MTTKIMIMFKPSFNRIQALWAFISFAVLMAAYYFQYVDHLQPCPLCIMQRLMLIILIVLLGLGAGWKGARGRRNLSLLELVFSLGGMYFAGRQLWLQSLHGQDVPACLPDLEVLWHYFPFLETLKALFLGGGDCAEVNWQWLGLSMPAWTLLYFIVVGCVVVKLWWCSRYEKNAL